MDSLSTLGPLAMFMFVMTITPGPNNLMLTASGANFGYWRTLPHIGGILIGCFSLFLAIALGLGALFQRFPALQLALQIAGSAYLLWLAWLFAQTPPPGEADAEARPLRFWQAAVFQLVNPKAWVMGIAMAAGFLPDEGSLLANAALVALIAELVALPCISIWTLFGTGIGRLLRGERAWRRFNRTMGLLTAACVPFLLL